MPAVIPPVGSGILTTSDAYTELLSIGPSRQIRSLQFGIGTTLQQPCIYQLATLDESNSPHWDPGCIFYGFPGVGGFSDLVYGIRFKSAIPGTPTDIICQVFFNGDPVPIAFGGSASATGGGGGGGDTGITDITSVDGTVTVVDNTGPTTDLSVAAILANFLQYGVNNSGTSLKSVSSGNTSFEAGGNLDLQGDSEVNITSEGPRFDLVTIGNYTIDVNSGNILMNVSGAIAIASNELGFFGATPVPQAAHPTTLADVITILQNLGLCA